MERSFANQQNAIANFKPFESIELLFVMWQILHKYCDKLFINKLAFLIDVPQLIKKIYCAGTTWFYRFACVIVVQAHISLMTRLKRVIKEAMAILWEQFTPPYVQKLETACWTKKAVTQREVQLPLHRCSSPPWPIWFSTTLWE